VDARTEHVFVANTLDDTVSVLAAASGHLRIVRTVAVGPAPIAVAVDAAAERTFVVSRGPLDYSGQPRGPGSVALLDTRTGALLHTVTVGTDPIAVAVEAQRRWVSVLNHGDSSVSVLAAASGRVLRTAPVGPSPLTLAPDPLALAVDAPTGHLIIPNYSGQTVSVLGLARSRVVCTVAVPGHPWAVVALARRRQVVVLMHGSPDRVSVLEAGTGRLRRSVAVGATPVALAVDARTNRVFVVSSGGARRTPDLWERMPGVPQVRRWLPWLPQPSFRIEVGSVSAIDVARL
jgi:DNA-binding beta-propeller fold protein YncE